MENRLDRIDRINNPKPFTLEWWLAQYRGIWLQMIESEDFYAQMQDYGLDFDKWKVVEPVIQDEWLRERRLFLYIHERILKYYDTP